MPSGFQAPSRKPPRYIRTGFAAGRRTRRPFSVVPEIRSRRMRGTGCPETKTDRAGAFSSRVRRASSESSERTHRIGRPSGPGASNAKRRPSGEKTPVLQEGGPVGREQLETHGRGNRRPLAKTHERQASQQHASAATPGAAAVSDDRFPEVGKERRSSRRALAGWARCFCSATRASPISRKRFFVSRSRHRRNSSRIAGGVSLGSWSKSIGARKTSASVWETVSPSKRRCPISSSHSITPNDQMSARLSTGFSRSLFRRHVGRGSENYAGPGRRHAQGRRVRGIDWIADRSPAPRPQVRSPEP